MRPGHAISASLATALVTFSGAPACMTIAEPAASGGTGNIIATGGSVHTSGGGTSGSGGTSSGGSGGNTGKESCQNGLDDDQDGKIDCADSDCTPGYTCVAIPDGWTTVTATTQGWASAAGKQTTCANGTPATRYFEGPAGAANCTSCSCGAPSGSCGNTPIACSMGDTTCASSSSVSVATCANFGAPTNGQISCTLGQTQPGNNSGCTASPATLTNPDTWQSVADTCPLGAGGCAGGQACVPTQDVAGPATCILDSGTSACPSGFPEQHAVFTGGTDQRSCGNCTCLATGLSCASDTFQLMTQQGCVDFGPFPTFTTTSCKSYTLSGTSTWSLKRVPATSKAPTGSCTAVGGWASGSVQTSGKTTLCCR